MITRTVKLTARQIEILEFVLDDLAEAIEDGDRPEFTSQEVANLRAMFTHTDDCYPS